MTTTTVDEDTTTTPAILDCDVLYTMRLIVDEFGPNYVYKKNDPNARCVYREMPEDGTIARPPGCLVGHVLHRLTPAYVPQEVGVFSQASRLKEAGYSSRAIAALQVAQTVQDRRHTWAAAVVAAGAVLDLPPGVL